VYVPVHGQIYASLVTCHILVYAHRCIWLNVEVYKITIYKLSTLDYLTFL
jgi:hypothetical protein